MAGQPKRRAMVQLLESRTRDYFEDDPVPTHLDYVACWIENGSTIVALAASLSTDLGYSVGREWLSGHLRRTFGDEIVDARLSNARTHASHCMAEQALVIADEAVETKLDLGQASNRIKARQWTAERWNAQSYGGQKGVSVNVSIGSLHLDALRSLPSIVTTALPASVDASHDTTRNSTQVVEAEVLSIT